MAWKFSDKGEGLPQLEDAAGVAFPGCPPSPSTRYDIDDVYADDNEDIHYSSDTEEGRAYSVASGVVPGDFKVQIPTRVRTNSVLVEPPRKIHEPIKTRVVRVLCWQVLFSILVCLPFVALSVFIPILNIITIPLLCFFVIALIIDIAFTAYMTLAQTDPPANVGVPFLPWDMGLVWRVNLAVWRWLMIGIHVGPKILRDWSIRRILASRGIGPEVKCDIHYGSMRPGKRLDVYRAAAIRPTPRHESVDPPHQDGPPHLQASTSHMTIYAAARLSPVIVFIHSPHLGPIRSRKGMYESLGANLSELGYTVVIPDLTFYPEGRAKEMVEDVRRVLRWTSENIRRFGGDPDNIHIMGHSLGAHLTLLTVLQEAVVASRDSLLAQDGPSPEMSNGLRKIQVYGDKVRIPKIAGLILLAPICDVNDQIVSEARRGVSHLSKMRRILGPTHTTAMFHSPAHILHASRNVVDVSYLPPKVLFMHGGLDDEVPHSQSEMMKEMLRGVGVADCKVRVYPFGHLDVLTGMMFGMDEPSSELLLHEVVSFIPL